MASSFHELVRGINVERLLKECQSHTGFDIEELRDQFFDVLAVMLEKKEQFSGAFPNERAFYGYLRKATIQNMIKRTQRRARQRELVHHQALLEGEPSEDALQDIFQRQDLRLFAQEKLEKEENNSEVVRECMEVLERVLRDPETYIRKRETGDAAGTLVFSHVALADSLGWSRPKLHDRLQRLRTVFYPLQGE